MGGLCHDRWAQVPPFRAANKHMQVASTMWEAEMKYLLVGLVVTFALTLFMVAMMTKAVLVELRKQAGRRK
jgi:hypothetical protein